MITLIIYDGNEYYQSTVSENSVGDIHARLLPREHEIMFTILDDVEVLDREGTPLESRSL